MPECVKPRRVLMEVESMWNAGRQGDAGEVCMASVLSVNSRSSMCSSSCMKPRSATRPSASQVRPNLAT
eukprot:6175809-Pleurochrysis_carterae.AAC.1